MPAPTVGQEQEDEQPERGGSSARSSFVINAKEYSTAENLLLIPNPPSGVIIGPMNKDGKVINKDGSPVADGGSQGAMRAESPTVEVNVSNDKKVTMDLRSFNGPNVSLQEIVLKTDSESEILLTNFTGQPPVRVEKGSDVDVQASSFMGFKQAAPGADGKPGMTSANVSFQREQDGSLTILRDGKPAMNIPKDTKTKVDLKDNDGKTLMTIEANKDVEDIKKEYLAAEKKAFKTFQSSVPDRSIKDATFRSGSEAAPEANTQQQGAPGVSESAQKKGPLGSMGDMSKVGDIVTQTTNKLGIGIPTSASEVGQQVMNRAIPGIQRVTGGGRGGPTGGGNT